MDVEICKSIFEIPKGFILIDLLSENDFFLSRQFIVDTLNNDIKML